jgi:hypothetical protein
MRHQLCNINAMLHYTSPHTKLQKRPFNAATQIVSPNASEIDLH